MGQDERISPVLDQNALDLVRTFPGRFPEIANYYFKFYVPYAGLDPTQRSIFDMSAEELLVHDLPEKLVARMLRDIDVDETVNWIRVSAHEFEDKVTELVEEARSSSPRKALAIYSQCRDSSLNSHHIPMMDLHIDSAHGRRALDLIVAALLKVGQTDGAILESGKSFHYYGLRLMSEPQWRRFMSACLLLGPLADVRYIGHRLLAGKAALRLSKAPHKDTEPKIVVCLINGDVTFTARYQTSQEPGALNEAG
jgi:hypothetical protein